MSLLSSLTCNPTLPAKSSSLRLGDGDKQRQGTRKPLGVVLGKGLTPGGVLAGP
jgi:hypothetical protein